MNKGSSRLDQSSINLQIEIRMKVNYHSFFFFECYRSKCSSSAVGYRLKSAQADANNERPLDITTR